jgi:hypothetical protein
MSAWCPLFCRSLTTYSSITEGLQRFWCSSFSKYRILHSQSSWGLKWSNRCLMYFSLIIFGSAFKTRLECGMKGSSCVLNFFVKPRKLQKNFKLIDWRQIQFDSLRWQLSCRHRFHTQRRVVKNSCLHTRNWTVNGIFWIFAISVVFVVWFFRKIWGKMKIQEKLENELMFIFWHF